jgi:hypothetical protein
MRIHPLTALEDGSDCDVAIGRAAYDASRCGCGRWRGGEEEADCVCGQCSECRWAQRAGGVCGIKGYFPMPFFSLLLDTRSQAALVGFSATLSHEVDSHPIHSVTLLMRLFSFFDFFHSIYLLFSFLQVERYAITSNVVSPWYIRTQMTEGVGHDVIASSPAKRLLEPEEVVGVMEKLCGEEGEGVTGRDLIVDGVRDPFDRL